MPRLRLACYNIAWFERLFDRDNRLIADDSLSAMPGVTRRRQAQAIAVVLEAVDADCYAVIEAPNTGHRQSSVTELERFAAEFGLRQRAALLGFPNPTHQEIALLFDPDRIAAEHAPVGAPLGEAAAKAGAHPDVAPRFDGFFAADIDGDGAPEPYEFSKPPLEAVMTDLASGCEVRLLAVHLKSKAPNISGTPAALRQRGLDNRVKQLAQATWLRARIDEHLAAGEEVIALGDFNDGPGFDALERVNGRSSVEVVAGPVERPEAQLVCPFLHPPAEPEAGGPATARFVNEATGEALDALIDFIMISPRLAAVARPVWRIWNPFDAGDAQIGDALRAALADASDHFPVSVDLHLPPPREG
jgi:endonuclease/exonuclease/phosphatase family metal-dependent hydrolase